MRQDDFERLNKLISEMESTAKSKANEQMCEGLRASVGVLERLVVALERIAANTAQIGTTSTAPAIDLPKMTSVRSAPRA